jgi:serine protease Do
MHAPDTKANWGLIALITSVIIVLVAIVGLFHARIAGMTGHVFGAPKVPVKVASSAPPVSLGEFKNGFASVIDPDLPAVVNISSTKVVKQQNTMPQFFNDPLFRQFFGDQFGPTSEPQAQKEYSLGSGVIVNDQGYILTNNHVVAGASDVQVFTLDRKKFKGKVIGTDPRTDIAVVKIEASSLPTLTLGDSSQLQVGILCLPLAIRLESVKQRLQVSSAQPNVRSAEQSSSTKISFRRMRQSILEIPAAL